MAVSRWAWILQGGTSFILQVDTSELDENAKRDAPERALEVIKNRIDELGGKEPLIYLEPTSDRIVVQIPGLESEKIERAKSILQQTAMLEFKLVHEDNTAMVESWHAKGEAPAGYQAVQQGGGRYLKRDLTAMPSDKEKEKELARIVRSFKAQPTTEMMLRPLEIQNQELFEPVYVLKRGELSGEHLETANLQQDASTVASAYVVTLNFDPIGTKRFRKLTVDYCTNGERNQGKEGRRLAILLDGKLFSAPTLQVPIYNGSAQIEGNFSREEAQELALVLRAGSLPAEVDIIEERSVAPSLGADSICQRETVRVAGWSDRHDLHRHLLSACRHYCRYGPGTGSCSAAAWYVDRSRVSGHVHRIGAMDRSHGVANTYAGRPLQGLC